MEMRTFGGLPGVWRGGSHPKRWQTSPDTVSAVIGRGSGSPIRRIFRDNPPNVRRVYKVTWEVCWPLIGQNIKMTNIVRGDDTGGRFGRELRSNVSQRRTSGVRPNSVWR